MTGQAGTTGQAGNGVARTGRLAGRLIALGITGSIAAYKAVELLRRLRDEGADVTVLMTEGAKRFVGALTLETLSGRPVDSDVLALLPDGRIGHITVGDSADAIVVAPATARWLAAMANGLADDTITATCLASTAPVVVAPAMDGDMYRHPATIANVARLREFGYTIVEPETGSLASGQTGVGRLASLPTIVDAIVEAVGDRPIRAPMRLGAGQAPRVAAPVANGAPQDLAGRHLVVTAGGTAEPIDPVRFIGNRSTGRMGVAIAEAALDRGAHVTLIAASVGIALPEGPRLDIVRTESAEAMRTALLAALRTPAGSAGFDALVMAAAVADFRPVHRADRKLERGASLVLELESTPDILAELAREIGGEPGPALDPRPVLVGFAAETGSLERAAGKLVRKGLDLLVANDVAEPGSGFGTDTNRVTIYARPADPAGPVTTEAWPLLSKQVVADRLLDLVARRLDERDAGRQTEPGESAARATPPAPQESLR